MVNSRRKGDGGWALQIHHCTAVANLEEVEDQPPLFSANQIKKKIIN
jgi:hypothetical protein